MPFCCETITPIEQDIVLLMSSILWSSLSLRRYINTFLHYMLFVSDRRLRLYVTRVLVFRTFSPSYQSLGCDQMETKLGDTSKVNQNRLNDEVPVAEQWIPVPSPSATTLISPSRNDGKKAVSTPIMLVSNGSDNGAPNTFMLQPAQELNRVTPSGTEVSVVDKYNIGFSPVDIHGRVLLDLKKTGGWRAALFIFGTDLIFSESFQSEPEQHRNKQIVHL